MRSPPICCAFRSVDRHQGLGLLCAMGAILAMTLISLDPGVFGKIGGSVAVALAFSSIVAFATRPVDSGRATVVGRVVPASQAGMRRAA